MHYNDSKFQSRTLVYVFLGYASGYKEATCSNLQTKKLILSRHVLHDESVFPIKCQPAVISSNNHVQNSVHSAPIIVQLRVQSMQDIRGNETVQSISDDTSLLEAPDVSSAFTESSQATTQTQESES